MKYNLEKMGIGGLIEKTKLSTMFFSENNINLLQKLIKYNVKTKTNKIISEQSNEELFIIMKSIFLNESNLGVKTDSCIKKELRKLDLLVTNECTKKIVTQIKQHIIYLDNINNLAVPMERAESTNIKGTKINELNRFI